MRYSFPVILFISLALSGSTICSYASERTVRATDLPEWQCYTEPLKIIAPPSLDMTITDPNFDMAGHQESTSWGISSSETYTALCPDCEHYYGTTRTWFYTRGTLPIDNSVTIGGRVWYRLDNNLDVAVETIFYDLGVARTVPVPHETAWSNDTYQQCEVSDPRWYSGNQGNVYFYFKKPFIGQHTVPPTVVAQIAAGHSGSIPINWNYPVANIQIQASIAVPESCTINAGTMVKISLDPSKQSDYRNVQPKMIPKGYHAKKVDIPVNCKQLMATSSIGFKFVAQADENTGLFKTNNPDIDIVLAKDPSGASLILPNSDTDLLPVPLTPQLQGNAEFYVYPTPSSAKIPQAGHYQASGTIVTVFP